MPAAYEGTDIISYGGSRISYCASDISLKSAAKRDMICSINKNLTVCKVMLRKCKVDAVVFVGAFSYNGSITTKEVLL